MQNSTVEIRFQLHATRNPDGETGPSATPRSGGGRIPRVTQVMALAIQFQEMIHRGEARDYADLARLGGVTRERMSQIMELVWLAPDIQQEILEFPPTGATRFPITEVVARWIASTLAWEEQRREWNRLRVHHNLS
jgi:hypothetical protein